ncbi:hypothetical protein CAEBREN_03405 [Caenorhabditis brenneri]|uniref:Uncharacterized protein n=1 Tax=Caenorhabditis brenneri TaxID=135651 RepID=G0N6B1_CAEBE|nr:hypothetical protein CAEBREN_03405 [Caenorhabditis brenneri]
MMHHPSQFGSNLNEPDPAATQYTQHPQSFETENNNTFNPKGNVAALRSVIHGQLDMKTPTGKAPSNSSRYQKPAPPPVDLGVKMEGIVNCYSRNLLHQHFEA